MSLRNQPNTSFIALPGYFDKYRIHEEYETITTTVILSLLER